MGCLVILALILAACAWGTLNYGPPIAASVVESLVHQARERVLDLKERLIPGTEKHEAYDLSSVGYLGQTLPSEQQVAYVQLLSNILELKESFSVLDVDATDIDPAFRALMGDHPELFWLDGSLTYTYSAFGRVVLATPGITMPLSEVSGMQARIEAAVEPFLSSIVEDASEYDKARVAYEYIISSCDYDLNAADSQNIVSVFIHKSSVCAGYTKAYQYLLNRMGLFCAYVEGTITTTGEDHAWNLVSIDGEYAYVDVTWGDPAYLSSDSLATSAGVIYDYLFLTTDEILKDHHVFTNPDIWPVCNATDLDYYRRCGHFFDSFDEDALSGVLLTDINQGAHLCGFKFGNDAAFNAALYAVENAPAFIVSNLSSYTDAQTYSYTVSDSLRIIKIYW